MNSGSFAGMFGILDIHLIVFMGCETIGIEIPESLDGRGKVSVGIGCVRGWKVECQSSWSRE